MSKALLSHSFSQLQEIFMELGFEKYRFRQILDWIFRKQIFDFSRMTNLSMAQREKLCERFDGVLPDVLEKLEAPDGTIKIALPLSDGEKVEVVAIPEEENLTFCLSTQVGCPVGCRFCRTGSMGFKRNLSSQEILLQYFSLANTIRKKPSNIVFMGMGEPFLNSKEVFEAIEIFTDRHGLNIGSRRITISTVGIPDGIIALSERKGEVNLAVSLHTCDSDTRSLLVPMNRKHSLEAIRKAVETYISKTNRRVSFEIVLLKGINDDIQSVLSLVEFCRGLLCHVNLIVFNPYPSCSFKPASDNAMREYSKALKKAGIPVTRRKSKGGPILAACGQLAGNFSCPVFGHSAGEEHCGPTSERAEK